MEMEKMWVSRVAVLLWILQAWSLVSAASTTINCSGGGYTWSYPQMGAIGNLYTNWSGTPNLGDKNLKRWKPVVFHNLSEAIQWWIEVCNYAYQPWQGLNCFTYTEVLPGYMYNCNGIQVITTYRISDLTLSNASITGPLPAAIGDLYPLRTLTLTGNPGLHGNIPVEILNLESSLTTLDLHNNNLSGAIPTGIFNFFLNLQNLDLSGNRFTGNISPYPLGPITRTFNLAHNQLTGNLIFNYFVDSPLLESVDVSYNHFSGPVPFFDFTYNPQLKYLNMGGNQFSAESLDSIPVYTTNASSSSLQVLDLSNNLINGDIRNLTFMIGGLGPNLQELYLDGNNISGTLLLDEVLHSTIRKNPNFKTLGLSNNNITAVKYNKTDSLNVLQYMRLGENPFCNIVADICGADAYAARCFCYRNCSDPSACNQAPSPSAISRSTILKIALSTSVPFALLLLIEGFLLYRSRRKHQYLLLQVQRICEEHDVKPTIFTYNELRAATRDFHPDMKLGQGGYGAVYKGMLPNSNVVAVKQLHINSQQGMDEFLNEVALISGIKHRNLVKLKGCCIREKQRLLVYEYVDNHDLDWNLLESNSFQVLSWPERLNICLGVAHGLHYLHALAQPKIIHRDIKAANILLDNNLQPKIADFGLALLFPEETSHIMTVHVAGTKGYLAPEYATLGQLSEKADVYSFGVVCLEIVSGRRNIDNKMPPEEVILTNLIQKLYKEGNIMGIVDSRLQPLSETEHLEVQRVIYTAMLCLQYSEDVRPPMARVVSMLQGDLPSVIEDLKSAQVPTSFFGSSSTSFDISQLSLDTIREGDSVRLNTGSSKSTFGSRC
ncbi:hypothetical protein KC19_7G146100 [Ceratodon purpureus]|uniref:Protein kinase domain-containing protein n=2 Tax=Ceratodon purpureus TaxID=3225 RepID=A0A8T0HBQ0_CERPU|nr:hypothetical protein KC19_7G146100 [Ceratodon purpureus]